MRHEVIYMSADQLGITEVERDGLLQIKRDLETGVIGYAEVDADDVPIRPGFNMNYDSSNFFECGSVLCIGGWMQLRGQLQGTVAFSGKALHPLFWPEELDGDDWPRITPAQAARAIGNFLSTGRPMWRRAVGEV